MTTAAPPRHFSMLRDFHIADFITLANGLCGVAAIFQAMHFLATAQIGALYAAAILVPMALVFDVLDGRVARARGDASALGRELDSLADLLSFGVAPTAIAYAIGLSTVIDQIFLGFFVLCGLSRLARYNVSVITSANPEGPVRYFEGTPIPTSILPLAIVLATFALGLPNSMRIGGAELHPQVLVFFISGCLMISKTIRIPKP